MSFFFSLLNTIGGSTPPTPNAMIERFGNDLAYFLDPSNLSTMMVENATNSTPVTDVANDGDNIGLIYDRGVHGFYATAESDATRPTLNSDVTVNAFIRFSSAASTRLRIINSQSYLRKLHEPGAVYSIHARVKFGASTNGTNRVLLHNFGGTTAHYGFRLLRGTANTWNIWIVAGVQRVLFSTTATHTEADGWKDIIINVNGTAGTIKVGSATTENFTLSASGSVGNATEDMRIGASPDGTLAFNGDMACVEIIVRNTVADDNTFLASYNPIKNTGSFVNDNFDINYNNTSRGFADTGKTTPITNNVGFRAWSPEVSSIFGPLNRDQTTASAGVSPVFKSSVLNGTGVVDFDGVDDVAGFVSSIFRERGGKGGFMLIAKNRRANLGSHFMSGGAPYLVGTGSTYPGGVLGVGNTYFTAHPAGGPGIGPAEFENKVEGWNVIIVQRNGSNWTFYTGLGIKNTAIDSNLYTLTNMGLAAITGWEADAQYGRLLSWIGVKTDAEMIALKNAAKSTYGI